MLEYDRIDIFEGTGVNKTSNSRECSLCVFMSKNDAFNLIKNSNIIDKKGVL